MGISSMFTRIAGLGLLAVMLAGCPQNAPTPDPATERTAGPLQTIICPGDTRCGQVELVESTVSPAPGTTGPRYQSCEVLSERVLMRCNGTGNGNNRPCPGPGCSTGQDPGAGDRCVIWRRYVAVRCPADDGSGEPPEQ